MKKLLSLGIAVCIIIVTSFPVYSESIDTVTVKGGTVKLSVLGGDDQNEDQDDAVIGSYNANEQLFPSLYNDVSTIKNIEQTIIKSLRNYDSQINISLKISGVESANGDGYYDYDESKAEYVYNYANNGEFNLVIAASDVLSIYNEIFYSNPEFFMTNKYGYGYSFPTRIKHSKLTSSNVIMVIVPTYNITKSEYLKHLSFCEKEIQKIINGMDKSFNDFEKVIYVHEYFVSNFAYDIDGLYDDDNKIGDMYGFFSEKRAVCQGYALAFKAVMDELKIENTTVVSKAGNHIWNMVKIGDNYYHIDCTQDDMILSVYEDGNDPLAQFPEYKHNISDAKGYADHQYLFSSDNAIVDEDSHLNWYTEPAYNNTITCTDTAYDTADWKSVGGKLCYFGDYWYSVSSSLPTNVLRFDRMLGNMTSVVRFDLYDFGNSSQYLFRGVVQCDNIIIFNDAFDVLLFDMASPTPELTQISEIELPDEVNHFAGCYYDGNGQLGYYYDNDYANTAKNFYDLEVGDIDRDEDYDGNDLTNLISYILGKDNDTYFNEFFADTTFDNIVDIRDIVALKNLIANQS